MAALVAATLTGCARQGPTMAEWRPRWETLRAQVPPVTAFASGPDAALCEQTLVILRESRDSVLPAPDEVIDAAVTDWLAHADTLFFECPPEEGELVGFEAAYRRLDSIAAEIESLLG